MSAAPPRPSLLPLEPTNIPPELCSIPAWLGWRLVFEDNRWTKKPIEIKTANLAETNNPRTWCDFQTALQNYARRGCDGIGLCRIEDFVFIDLDGIFDLEGNLHRFPWATKIVTAINRRAYMEKSVSGTGLHAIARGSVPPGRRQFNDPDREHTGFAFYDKSRFFTFSGQTLPDSGEIHELSDVLVGLHSELFPIETARGTSSEHTGVAQQPETPFWLNDSELLERARNARNGSKFLRLWTGDWRDYPSQSEADLALCRMLAFWCGPDPSRIDALFRESGLARDKWLEREDYRECTIERALRGLRNTYQPRSRCSI